MILVSVFRDLTELFVAVETVDAWDDEDIVESPVVPRTSAGLAAVPLGTAAGVALAGPFMRVAGRPVGVADWVLTLHTAGDAERMESGTLAC